jgi:glycosyltransferase involved in cell wall biosynthesis
VTDRVTAAKSGSRADAHDQRSPGGPTLSVVICTYSGGRWNDLRQAVESVARQTYPALETIVVVDHDAALVQRVRTGLPSVVAVQSRGPRGLSGARNTGLGCARGDVVAFLDDDAAAAPDWLELLAREYEDAQVLGAGGSIVPAWTRQPAWFPPEFDWVVGCTYRGLPPSRAPVRNLIGANMSFRRELFQKVGGFRVGIGRIGTRPLGCEETEFCIRAGRACPDGVFVYQPRARVRHRVPEQRASWRYFLSRCYAEGLSKSQVVSAAGTGRGLAAERSYTLRTLPLGFLSGLLATATLRDSAGALRAGAIAVGLLTTTIGFCVGQLSRAPRPATSSGREPHP